MKIRTVAISTFVVLVGILGLILSGCSLFNQQPIADLNCNPLVAPEGSWVDFDGTKSEDPDGEIIQYLWDFGDGGVTDDSGIVSAFYPEAGIYNVSLTVMDDKGSTHTREVELEILPRGDVGNTGYHDPKVGVYLWAENPETGEKITGTTPIFDSFNQHVVV